MINSFRRLHISLLNKGAWRVFILLTLVLASCGTDSKHFMLEGRLLNLNQGEFYVYSTDGLIDAVDTIHVQAGRFSYKTECTSPGTLVIVFPNFSEQPVFAQPGKSVSVEGDAYKLKEMKVTGTDENKLMNSFRERAVNASPVETCRYVEQFVQDHPESLVSIYLVRKYFIVCQNPDYKKAAKLFSQIEKAQPDNGRLKLLTQQIKAQSNTSVGTKLPAFSVTDTDGKKVTQADFAHGDGIIYVWSTWEYESANIQRFINGVEEGKIKALGLCVDASEKDCKKTIERDHIKIPVACDGKMFEGKAINALGLTVIPDNILIKDGKIVARGLTSQEIREKLNKL